MSATFEPGDCTAATADRTMRQHAGEVRADGIAAFRQVAERRARQFGERRRDQTQIRERRIALRDRAQQDQATRAVAQLLSDRADAHRSAAR